MDCGSHLPAVAGEIARTLPSVFQRRSLSIRYAATHLAKEGVLELRHPGLVAAVAEAVRQEESHLGRGEGGAVQGQRQLRRDDVSLGRVPAHAHGPPPTPPPTSVGGTQAAQGTGRENRGKRAARNEQGVVT